DLSRAEFTAAKPRRHLSESSQQVSFNNTLLRTLQSNHGLDMKRVREHLHRHDLARLPSDPFEMREVAREALRIAAHVDDRLRSEVLPRRIEHARRAAFARRIEHDRVETRALAREARQEILGAAPAKAAREAGGGGG